MDSTDKQRTPNKKLAIVVVDLVIVVLCNKLHL